MHATALLPSALRHVIQESIPAQLHCTCLCRLYNGEMALLTSVEEMELPVYKNNGRISVNFQQFSHRLQLFADSFRDHVHVNRASHTAN